MSLPTDEPLLDDFDVTKESLKDDDIDALKAKLKVLACADWRLFMKLLVSQGYDLWLTKAFLPTHVPKYCGKMMRSYVHNLNLLKKVKRMTEREFCDQKKAVLNLGPEEIRLLHKFTNLTPVKKIEVPAKDVDADAAKEGEAKEPKPNDEKVPEQSEVKAEPKEEDV